MKPLVFLGQTLATDNDFRREFPAYAGYLNLVRSGCDTPLKIEVALYRKQLKSKRGPRFGAMKKRKAA